ncbi:hypothetical protein ATJ88_1487 [Isoptericola jiangsuensis]|uniref:Uncharacterized protein n=1 Tax=Isoptericola jiangsuensis TaxID=548579 RepID=A0A2A9EX56_9MICO|nr:hypothetical protein [Isoptericola jiangsuensis]PFG42815.1 hypothetical protein ATJ88_1487 [Isoptericola jiangsuensis]
MTVRAVVLPATALLVPGAGGATGALQPLRDAVLAALAEAATTTPRRWAVLADAAVTRRDARRASLAAAGVADRWVPALPPAPAGPSDAVAGVAASVALWAVAAVAGPGALADTRVVETGPGASPADVVAAADVLVGADLLVVASPGPHGPAGPASAVLADLARRGGWSPRTATVRVDAPHLPPVYEVTSWSTPAAAGDGAAAHAD